MTAAYNNTLFLFVLLVILKLVSRTDRVSLQNKVDRLLYREYGLAFQNTESRRIRIPNYLESKLKYKPDNWNRF